MMAELEMGEDKEEKKEETKAPKKIKEKKKTTKPSKAKETKPTTKNNVTVAKEW